MFWFKVRKNRRRGLHRKRRKDTLAHVREWLWPSIGWVGLLRFMEIRLKRRNGSAHSIAMGFAAGAFASCTPFLGGHSFLAVAIAWPTGGSILAAVIGTIVGNPWTFPFIWVTSFELGIKLMGRNPDKTALPEKIVFSHLRDNLDVYWDKYLLPMTIGGTLIGLAVGLFFYILLRVNISQYRKLRAHRLMLARERSRKAKKA